MVTTPIDEDTGEIRVRPFADVLADLGREKVVDEAGVQLQQLVNTVAESGRKGRLVLTVEVAPMKGNSAALMVHAKSDLKLPAAEPVGAVFFYDDDGNLLRDDPRQLKFNLRELNAPSDPKDLKKA
ncbi:hypothetical protein [Actinomadura rubrisoli]|uniref:Uncharacterized protein n=1 Tax=Actinomadura rubrisoli TaxID=2530368 RepID=A0A4R5A8L7_9ACTN|nr:hypothetical protein [Actinomadura rubrisoli]TDD68588.1 hypothetical protein E1298_38300 [Actinomadura rubrisoli]